jgi:hypothetical protein
MSGRLAGSGKREAGSGDCVNASVPSVPASFARRIRRLAAVVSLFPLPASLFPLPALAQTHVVIVSGLGGEKKYTDSFATLASTFADAANKRFGIQESEVLWFGEDSASKKPYFKGQSTKANVERALVQLAGRAAAGDQVIVVLIGHGSGEGDDSKISLPGPDLTARDFSALLGRFATQKVAFVNLTSASGDMLPVVAAPNRVVITATKSAFERNETHFAEYFIGALTKDVADTDKDGRVSLFEAFKYAVAETKRLYENDTRLQTEHAQLDDMGAKAGVADPDGRTGQGVLARRFFLDGAFVSRAGANDPQLATLYKDKFALEDRLEQLRAKKASMTPEAFDDALEDVLVQLARKAKTIREIEGRKS